MSRPGAAVVTVRFFVGEDREDSLVKLYNKLYSNTDQVPPVVESWVVKPIEIDDVPIVIATFWTDRTDLYGDHELRRMAEELQHELQAIPNTNRVWVTGGRPRRIRVELDAQRLAARATSATAGRGRPAGQQCEPAGRPVRAAGPGIHRRGGSFFAGRDRAGNLVVSVTDDRPVYLQDVAQIIDGPAEVEATAGSALAPLPTQDAPIASSFFPAVHLAVAKKKGSNAVAVARQVEARSGRTGEDALLPDGVHYHITRDYGETANDKVNELVEGLVVAVLTVIGLIGLVIGWRAALVVALAIPVCYSLTLFVNLLGGYTINRVTMFALILSLGLLVDDPITDVENIARYFAMRVLPPRQAVLRAIQEVRPALILSTLAIIASFLPLVFITGMMGPYMAPMALNVPLTVTLSTVVAFIVTPGWRWSRFEALGSHGGRPRRPFDPQRLAACTARLERLLRPRAQPALAHLARAGGRGRAVRLGGGRACSAARAAEDAAVRQQERVSGHRRHARGHDAWTAPTPSPAKWPTTCCGWPRSATSRCSSARLAHGLQRHGAALLPAHRTARGRHSRESGPQGQRAQQSHEILLAHPTRPGGDGRSARREHQAGRGPARPARAGHDHGRGLRAARSRRTTS